MGDAKRRHDKMLKSQKWVFYPAGDLADPLYGKLEDVVKIVVPSLFGEEFSLPDFFIDWEKAEKNSEYCKIHNKVFNTCLRNGEYGCDIGDIKWKPSYKEENFKYMNYAGNWTDWTDE